MTWHWLLLSLFMTAAILARPDSLATMVSDSTSVDRPAIENRLDVEARSQLWLWRNADRNRSDITLRFREPGGPGFLLPQFRQEGLSADAYAIPQYDFRSDPAYISQYLSEITAPPSVANDQRIMLSINELIKTVTQYLNRNAGDIDKLPANLSLTDTEIHMLSMLWGEAEISTEEWYLAYSRSDFDEPMTFLLFRDYIESLAGRGLINRRIVMLNWFDRFRKPVEKFTTVFSRRTILQKIRNDLHTSDILVNGGRHMDLLRIQERLDGLSTP